MGHDGPVSDPSVTKRAAIGAAALGGSAVVGAGAASVAGAAYFARKVLTPDRRRPDDAVLLEVGPDTVVLGISPDTVVPGRYGLWLEGGRGHVRIGEILETDPEAGDGGVGG